MLNRIVKVKIIALFMVFGQVIYSHAQTRTVEFDAVNSTISFQVKHLGVLKVDGTFKDFSGTFTIKDSLVLKVNCTIKTASINTDDESRDKTLNSEPYLDTVHYPVIEFQGTKTVIRNDSKELEGQLRIKNVEKRLYLPYEIERVDKSFSLRISTTLSRKDFDLDFGSMNGLIGDKIKVAIKIQGKPVR